MEHNPDKEEISVEKKTKDERPIVNKQSDEIDLIELLKVIWSRKWFIAKVTGIFMVLGLIIAFTSPEEYKTSSTLIPEMVGQESKISGSLGGLASLAGVDLGGLSSRSNQTINPALYQSVSQSTPFLLELMNQEYHFEEIGETISIHDYYIEYYKTGLFRRFMSVPGNIINWIKGSHEEVYSFKNTESAIRLTKDQQSIIEDLQSRVSVEMNWDLNLVTVEVEMQDPVVTAKMANFTQDYIRNYVTEYAISKGQQQLKSIEKQYQTRKSEFEKVQSRLAYFRDKNQNMTTARARSEEERLQSKYELAFNIYNQLAQQREAISLQIQENTPVFTILEPVKVPVKKSKPKKFVIFLIAMFFGSLVSVAITLAKSFFHFFSSQ